MADSSRRTVMAKPLNDFCVGVLEALDVPHEDARLVAESLVRADLRGVESHGVVRLPIYAKRLQMGGLVARPKIDVVRETRLSALLDGGSGMGQVVGTRAMHITLEKARVSGIGLVAVRNSSHFGTCDYYTMMALAQGMIGICLTNTATVLAPTGGITRLLGNNPWSVAVPAAKEVPIVVDWAVSSVARGKVRLAAMRDERIPLGLAMNSQGEPTEDPNEALKGLLLPVGEHKGYGMALIIDALTGVLAGAGFGPGVRPPQDYASHQNVGHLFGAIDVEMFTPRQQFLERVDQLIGELRASKLAKGSNRIYIPGELESLRYRERLDSGIPLSEAVIESLRKQGDEVGVPLAL